MPLSASSAGSDAKTGCAREAQLKRLADAHIAEAEAVSPNRWAKGRLRLEPSLTFRNNGTRGTWTPGKFALWECR
jgi:hypothetical protein